jgi:hypothetical protein
MVTASTSRAAAAALAFVAALFTSTMAQAQEVEPPPPPAAAAVPETPSPTIHHAPHVTARIGSDVRVGAMIERTDKVKRALLLYSNGQGTEGEIEFARSSDGDRPYVAVIPGAAVRGPMISYAIEIETTDGERLPVFATRAKQHSVTVLDSAEDAREGALLTRLGGRRSVVQTSGEYVAFGTSTGDVRVPDGTPGGRIERRSVKDQYYRVEGAYTYRLLGVVSEFGMRAGVVRGRSLVAGESDPSKYDVGLNYGAPRIRLRADDWVHFEGELLISVTEVGFSTGGGGAVLLGDAYGSKLTLGVEAIQVFGVRGYTRLDVVANKRLTLSPMVEVSNMPHADTAGVRLLAEAGVNMGAGFQANVRGGYQARSFDQGGPTLGGGLSYAF